MSTLVTNRLEYMILYSDLCYPDLVSKDRKLSCIVVIDPEYASQRLRRHYGADKIANKYVVNVDDMLWYQHDSQTWLLGNVNSK